MPFVHFEKRDGGVGLVTLDDEKNLNALSVPMGREFAKLAKFLSKEKEIRAVVLTGAGRAFSSGGNLDMITGLFELSRPEIARRLKTFYKFYLSVRDWPQPVIAAVNGAAVGAGFCLALACDLKYASDEARMGANFARLGLAPGMAGTFLLSRLAGPVRAAEILFTGRLFDAATAERYGLLNGVFPAAELLSRALEIAAAVAANAPLPLRQIKKGLQLAPENPLPRMFDYDAKSQALCLKTADIREGIAAAREKRPPRFSGK